MEINWVAILIGLTTAAFSFFYVSRYADSVASFFGYGIAIFSFPTLCYFSLIFLSLILLKCVPKPRVPFGRGALLLGLALSHLVYLIVAVMISFGYLERVI